MKQNTRRNAKRIIAALLASVILCTDCVSGFAAEADIGTDVVTETETLEEQEITEQESELTGEMSEESAQVPMEEESPHVLFEMEELREQSSKQYRLSDGTILAAQYGMDVHYEDADGEWAEIDNRFLYEAAENEADFDGYKSAEGAVEFKFAPQVQEGELVKISHEDNTVGFEMLPPVTEEEIETIEIPEEAVAEEQTEILLDENAEILQTEEISEEEKKIELAPAPISFLQGEVLNAEEIPAELAAVPAVMSLEDEAEVVWADISPGTPAEEDAQLFEDMKAEEAVTSVGYGNVLPGVSLQYVLSGSSLKEYILVNEKSDSYSYDFAMNLENLEPEMQEDGSILLKDDESGTAVYEIPAGYMTDAADEYSDAVAMSVTENEEGNWILNVTADAEWINAEERVFPVQIDPTLNKLQESSANMRGCYAEKANPEVEYENPGNLKVGYDTDIQEARIYIQFRNLPQLPKNSVICNSACYFDIVSVAPWEGSILYILAQKVKGNPSWDYEFTWDNRPEVGTAVMDHQKIQYSNTNSKYIGWDITELVKEHYSATDAATRVSTFAMIGQREAGTDEDDRAKVGVR